MLLSEKQSILLDNSIVKFINNIFERTKTSTLSKITFTNNNIVNNIPWIGDFVINIDKESNIHDSYIDFNKSYIKNDYGVFKIYDFEINILFNNQINNNGNTTIKIDLHHELVHLYEIFKKASLQLINNGVTKLYLSNIDNSNDIAKISISIDSTNYAKLLELKRSNNIPTRYLASILYFVLNEERSAMLNSYYEELIRFNLDRTKTDFFEYMIMFETLLDSKLNKTTRINLHNIFSNIVHQMFGIVNNDPFIWFEDLLKKLRKIKRNISIKSGKVYQLAQEFIDNNLKVFENEYIPGGLAGFKF